jgi:curved DNA-binding protein CbpA
MTHYEVLGVDVNADVASIKAAYHSRVLLLHPDKRRHSPSSSASEFDALQLAWHTLRDVSARAAYDASLRERAMLSAPISVVSDVDLDDMQFDELSRLFLHACRCGDVFSVSEDQLASGLDCPIACHGCSLQIRVLYEPSSSEDVSSKASTSGGGI